MQRAPKPMSKNRPKIRYLGAVFNLVRGSIFARQFLPTRDSAHKRYTPRWLTSGKVGKSPDLSTAAETDKLRIGRGRLQLADGLVSVKFNIEQRSDPMFAFIVDDAVQVFHDLLGDVHAQPGATHMTLIG